MTLKYVKTDEEGCHTVMETTGFWRWTTTTIWVGRSTIWHRLTDGRRGGTMLEGRLSNFMWLMKQRGEVT